MRIRTLQTEQWFARPRPEVFAFFSDARNLQAITPPWLHFQILTPMPLEMKAGALLDYRLYLRGLPVRWRTEITEWNPPYHFVDTQLRGPYRQWIHTHRFVEKDGGTLVQDQIEYAVPGWFLEPMLHRFLVGPDLKKVFGYREQRLRELLPAPVR